MKILCLIGSLRKASLNRAIYNHYLDMAKGQAELIEGKHDDFPLYNDEIRENGIPANVLRLADQIRQSEGVLFFSPEYNYGIPGPLKNTIDWLSRVKDKDTDQPFAKKPAAILSASPGALGGARMQYQLRQTGVFLDLRFMNKHEVMIGKAEEKIVNGKLVDEKTQKFLQGHLTEFIKFVQANR